MNLVATHFDHDNILAAAKVRTKGQLGSLPSADAHRHNVRAIMKDRLPSRVLSLLEEAGRLGDQESVQVFVVGGFVRDLLLGIESLDMDLAVEGDGVAFARSLGRKHKARVKVHERFRTAVVIFPDGFKLDVATARSEYYEHPAALPTVEPSSIKKDLYRRDFTINSLAVRINARSFGELIDFYGGQRDLKEGTIRVLHSLSFVDDPTRVFRAIRFEQRFGFRLGRETLRLIKGAVKMDLFHRLSGHRLLEELILLLSEEEPRKALARLGELDLLRFIHPALKWSPHLAGLFKGVEQALDWHRLLYRERKVGAGGARGPVASVVAAGDEPSPARIDPWLVYFMALMETIQHKAMEAILQRLTVPKRYAKKVRDSHRASPGILRHLVKRPPPKPAETYRLLKGQSDESLLLLMAGTKSKTVKHRLSAYLTSYQQVQPVLTGTDLKAMGLKPGPQYRKILERLVEARLNGQVTSEAEERELVKQIARL